MPRSLGPRRPGLKHISTLHVLMLAVCLVQVTNVSSHAGDDAVPREAGRVVTPATLPGAETFFYRGQGGEPAAMRIHLFKPEGWTASDRRPALVHFFGGGFLRGTPLNSAGWARTAARWGMVGIAPDYRTRERFGTDATACVADARAALRWVQDHAAELGIDPERIAVSGSSAGGHLALWTAITHSPPGSEAGEAPLRKPASLVLFSAACDTSATSGQRGDRFGGHGDACSPLHQLDDLMPPVLLFHGDADPTVPYSHAVALDRTLRAGGNLCEFITIPGGGHNINAAPGWREKVPELVRDFLRRQNVLVTTDAASRATSSAPPGGVRGRELPVSDATGLEAVLVGLQPGDTVVMEDGIWADADLLFRGEGEPDAPITLRARTPGRVVLTGASRLRISGRHLVVDGLLIRGCVQARGRAVVEFRDGDGGVATHCRLTQSAIIDCNPQDRLTDYKWLSVYGTDNRIDRCRFSGKAHQGALLVVWLDGQANRHRIHRNHFGPRPPHDRNGAETIRIGTSDWSNTTSATVIEENYFYRCDGEQEIISSKSCGNLFRRNTFVECQGALTLRHGNACIVTANVFLGRGRERTGGVRIIGEDHRVTNNYFEGLTGDRYYAALSMVLGIPQSPLNGYSQVQRAEVTFNTFVDNRRTFSIGVIEDRPEATLPPVDCVIANNVIVRAAPDFMSMPVPAEAFRIEGNLVEMRGSSEGRLPEGFRTASLLHVRDAAGLHRPQSGSAVVDAAVGDCKEVFTDRDGQVRSRMRDVGADEWVGGETPPRFIVEGDVGPAWWMTGGLSLRQAPPDAADDGPG